MPPCEKNPPGTAAPCQPPLARGPFGAGPGPSTTQAPLAKGGRATKWRGDSVTQNSSRKGNPPVTATPCQPPLARGPFGAGLGPSSTQKAPLVKGGCPRRGRGDSIYRKSLQNLNGHKKTAPGEPGAVFCLLALGDRAPIMGAHGAGTSAGTAINAGAGVDDVLGIALSDGAHGAAVNTGTAADASVTDDIGHNKYTSIKMVFSILAHFQKIAMFIFGDF